MIDRKIERRYRKLRQHVINNNDSKKFEEFINDSKYTHYELEKDYLNLSVSKYIRYNPYGNNQNYDYGRGTGYSFKFYVNNNTFNELYTCLYYSVPYFGISESEEYVKLSEVDKYRISKDTVYNLIKQPESEETRSFDKFAPITILIIEEALIEYIRNMDLRTDRLDDGKLKEVLCNQVTNDMRKLSYNCIKDN